jgi:hypothetical protein
LNWICPRCRLIVAGGLHCPDCGPGVPLLDVADPRNREYLVGQGANIRRLYAARLTMLRFFIGTLAGVAVGFWLVRIGVAHAGAARWTYFVLALLSGLTGLLAFAPVTRAAQRAVAGAARRAAQRLFSYRWAKAMLRARR